MRLSFSTIKFLADLGDKDAERLIRSPQLNWSWVSNNGNLTAQCDLTIKRIHTQFGMPVIKLPL
jgi:hypothetical protein